MRTKDMPWWLQDIDIIGFEDEEEDDSEEHDDEDESEEEDEENESDDEDENEDDEGEDDDEEESKPNISGLKSALRKERMARKKLEREIKKLRKDSESKPKSKENEDEDEDKSSAELEAERQKSERLAARLRDQAIDTLILKHAKNFADPDDAVRLINRREIEFDQDDEDPSEIEVDEDSVKDAVKALAKKKKHLLASATDKSKSGSKFNGKKKSTKEPSEEALRQKYSALRR